MLTADQLMDLALRQAYLCPREVKPNPRVGAALELISGEVIAGFHPFAGGLHAERVVLEECHRQSKNAQGARIAVTLEPCSHFGKTPPCDDALIEAQVSEVILPFPDPNPKVRGNGISKLRNKGIKITEGIKPSACFALNREWLWAQKLARPFVSLKIATSENHIWKTALPWITSEDARSDAMQLRDRVDFLITSGKTVREDDPRLTVRERDGSIKKYQPQIIILSNSKDVSKSAKVYQLSKPPRIEKWDDLAISLGNLHQSGASDVMVEAGPDLSRKFLEAGLVDEVWRYVAETDLKGIEADLTLFFKDEFVLIESKKIDEDNRREIWTRNSRLEKNFLSLH